MSWRGRQAKWWKPWLNTWSSPPCDTLSKEKGSPEGLWCQTTSSLRLQAQWCIGYYPSESSTSQKSKICRTPWNILRLELEFSREKAEPIEVLVIGERLSTVQLIKTAKFYNMNNFVLKKITDRIHILNFKYIWSLSAKNFQFPMKQDNTFQRVNTSKNTPVGHSIMVARKNNTFFYGDSYQNPIWMYPNVQTQLDGSRLETVNNEVVQQNPNSCGLICLYFVLKLFDNTKHLYVESNLELIRVMISFCKKKTGSLKF